MYQPNHFLNHFCKCTTYKPRSKQSGILSRQLQRLAHKKKRTLSWRVRLIYVIRESAGAVSRALCCPTTLSAHA